MDNRTTTPAHRMTSGISVPANAISIPHSTPSIATNTSRQAHAVTPNGAPIHRNPIALERARSPSLHDDDATSYERGFSPVTSNMRQGSSTMGPPPKPTPHQSSSSQADASQGDAPQAVLKAPSVYPRFEDGDVQVISPTGRTWKLHSMMLGNASPRFKEIFNSSTPYQLSKKMRAEGNTIRWRLLMVPEPAAKELDPNGLQFKNFKFLEYGDKKSAMQIPDNINGLGAQEGYNKLYDNLFRCIYNIAPQFTNDIDGPSEGKLFILDASTLLQAAVFLDAVNCVRVIIEAHLLRLNQLLWHHISNRPEGWVHLAARLQSPLMFREAMLHIVGKFHLVNGIDEQLLKRPAFGEAGQRIWQLIVDKAIHLKRMKLLIERHLLEYYPARMVHKEDEGEYVPGRATYANDIYLWMALSLFRQYVSSAYLSNFHHRASDGGLSFYRTLGAADATYLRAETLKRFHGSFDMSFKGKVCLYAAVEAIKNDVKPIVARLLIDRSQATHNPNAPRLPHLTCTEILDHELPWYVPPPAPVDDVEMGDAV